MNATGSVEVFIRVAGRIAPPIALTREEVAVARGRRVRDALADWGRRLQSKELRTALDSHLADPLTCMALTPLQNGATDRSARPIREGALVGEIAGAAERIEVAVMKISHAG